MKEEQDLFDNIKLYEEKYDKAEHVVLVGGREEVRNFIGNTAFKINYGLYRCWEENGKYYYDCGDIIYYTKVPIKLEIKLDYSSDKKGKE